MPAKRITVALTACVMTATGASASWDCRRDSQSGAWVCTGAAAAPSPPATAVTSPLPTAPATMPAKSAASPAPEPPAAAHPPAESAAIGATRTETMPTTPEPVPAPKAESGPSTPPPPPARPVEKAAQPPLAESRHGAKPTEAPTPRPVEAAEAVPADTGDNTPAAAADEAGATGKQAPVADGGDSVSEPAKDHAGTGPDPGYRPDLGRLHEGLDWSYCGPQEGRGYRLGPMPEADAPIELSADSAELYRRENRAVLSGNVVVDRGPQHLEAQRAEFQRDSGILQAEHLLLQQPGLRMLGRQGEMDLPRNSGQLQQVHYRLTDANARGGADLARIIDPQRSEYRNITYSTCPPDSNAWELQADEMELDRAEGRGVARNAKLRVGGVPVFYTPYMSFPLDDRRKSGFLAPSLGLSDRLGTSVGIPYYFNIAPEMDATLTPSYLSERGFKLGGEFRYLTAREHGEFRGEILPDDKGATDVDSLRGGASFRQRGRFGERWGTDLDLAWVSDDTYLEDFGNNLSVTSARNLERRADLYYFGDGWNLLGRVQGYQTVDRSIAPQNRPYSRLPQVLFTGFLPWQSSLAALEAEYVYFDHGDKVKGSRAALRPSLSLPIRRSYGHLTPKLTLNHSSYWLENQANGQDDQPGITLPTASLDAGLVFEKQLHWLGESATQTLEPRLFYLYTPYEDQSDVPVFDSAELDFSFASLFRENRFSGRDRIGDANQLALALTSRTLSERSGRELFRLSIGQIFYFEDRRVQIQGQGEDDSASELAGELAARFDDNWSGRASLLWDPNRGSAQIRKSGMGLHYRGPEGRLMNLTYRQNDSDRDDDTDYRDTDLSFLWPVNPQWGVVGRWLYSLEHGQTMEAFGGVEYRQCCWRVRGIVRSFVNSPDEQSDLSFLLQFELNGLGTLGSGIDEFLERGIYGYEVE